MHHNPGKAPTNIAILDSTIITTVVSGGTSVPLMLSVVEFRLLIDPCLEVTPQAKARVIQKRYCLSHKQACPSFELGRWMLNTHENVMTPDGFVHALTMESKTGEPVLPVLPSWTLAFATQPGKRTGFVVLPPPSLRPIPYGPPLGTTSA